MIETTAIERRLTELEQMIASERGSSANEESS